MQRTDHQVQVPRFAAVAAWAALFSALAAACSSTMPLSPARSGTAAGEGPAASVVRTGAAPQGAASVAPAATPGSGGQADCAARQAALAETTRAVETARQRKADAWKLVMPLAVVARRAQAGSELEKAEQQLAEQRTLAGRDGCTSGR